MGLWGFIAVLGSVLGVVSVVSVVYRSAMGLGLYFFVYRV